MKKHSLLLLLIATALAASAQKSDSLIGKWLYCSVRGSDTLDPAKLGMYQSLMGGTNFLFKKNHRYRAQVMGGPGKKVSGNWMKVITTSPW